MKNRSIAVVASVLLLVGRAPLAAQCWPASLCQDSCDSCQSCELSDAAPVSCGSATCVEVVACPEACDEVSPPTTPAVEDVVPSASTTEVAPPEEDVASEEPPAAPPGDTTLSDEPAAPPVEAPLDAPGPQEDSPADDVTPATPYSAPDDAGPAPPADVTPPGEDLFDEPRVAEPAPAVEPAIDDAVPAEEPAAESVDMDELFPSEPDADEAPAEQTPPASTPAETPDVDDLFDFEFGVRPSQGSPSLAWHGPQPRRWTAGGPDGCEAWLVGVTADGAILQLASGERVAAAYRDLSNDDLRFIRNQIAVRQAQRAAAGPMVAAAPRP